MPMAGNSTPHFEDDLLSIGWREAELENDDMSVRMGIPKGSGGVMRDERFPK